MIPTVFVSSTVADLHHIRDALRERIAALGYNPVLSDHNGVGYVPSLSAVGSCLKTVSVCSLAVVIVGRRYGTIVDDGGGISVTHKEYRAAREAGVPVFCLVDRDVLAFEQVFDANTKSGDVHFPEQMDNAIGTFTFLREIRASKTNNGLLAYHNVSDACQILTAQLAHFFGNLLGQESNPAARQISEVFTELTKLRAEVRRQADVAKSATPAHHHAFVVATQFLVSESYKQLRSLLVTLSGGVVEAITDLLEYTSLQEYFQHKSIRVTCTDDDQELAVPDAPSDHASTRTRAWFLVPEELYTDDPRSRGEPGRSYGGIFITHGDKAVVMNSVAHKFLSFCYRSIRDMAYANESDDQAQP
jgi:hypothetical protein